MSDSNSIVAWQEPPVSSGRNPIGFWMKVAAELRSRPGQWALVKEGAASSTAIQIKTGVLAAFRPAGTFEARTSQKKGSTRADIYARFVGDQP